MLTIVLCMWATQTNNTIKRGMYDNKSQRRAARAPARQGNTMHKNKTPRRAASAPARQRDARGTPAAEYAPPAPLSAAARPRPLNGPLLGATWAVGWTWPATIMPPFAGVVPPAVIFAPLHPVRGVPSGPM
jgi:hypothetical protein